jgi:microcystin-dependent protein
MSFSTKPNSWVSQDTSSSTQLSYALQVNPAPITVSVPGEESVLASLEFVVTNPTGSSLSVETVDFTIQVGTGASITQTTAGISTGVSDTTDWVVTGPPSPVTSGSATYTLAPKTGSSASLAAGASVVVQIFQIQTNSTPGNSTVRIKEIVGSTPAFANFEVTTFPRGFHFNGLAAASRSGTKLVPVAQINNGSTVTLTWNSSVVDTSAFTIYYSNASQGQQQATPSDIGEWISPPLSSDTVFTVVVKTSVQGGQTLTASMSTAVSVLNPALVAASLSSSNFLGPSGIFNFLNDSDSNSPVFAVTAVGGSTTATINTDQGIDSWAKLVFQNKSTSWEIGTSNGYENDQFYVNSTTHGAAGFTLDVGGNIGLNGNVTVTGNISATGSFSGFGIVPIGSIMPFAGPKSNIPNGWLLCDGSAVSITEYASLYAVIADIYGPGDDSSTTFNLPDYRGMFLRGTDDGANQDPDAALRTGQVNSNGAYGTASGDTVGSRQADEFANHSHSYQVSTYVGKGNGSWDGSYWDNGAATTGEDGGNETRPKNVYVNYLIRAL